MAERVEVREIDGDEGRRLVLIVRGGNGSVVAWRRVQMVLLSAQKMPVVRIAEVTFTSVARGAGIGQRRIPARRTIRART